MADDVPKEAPTDRQRRLWNTYRNTVVLENESEDVTQRQRLFVTAEALKRAYIEEFGAFLPPEESTGPGHQHAAVLGAAAKARDALEKLQAQVANSCRDHRGIFYDDLGTLRCRHHRLEWVREEIAPVFTVKHLLSLIASGAACSTVEFILENVAFRMRLVCEMCGELHLDVGEFATKLHHTHTCQRCGVSWRPAVEYTVGVKFLPGFKNEVSDGH